MADPVPNPDRPAFPLEYAPALGALRGYSKLEAGAFLVLAGLAANPEIGPALVAGSDAITDAVVNTAHRLAARMLANLGEPIP